MADVGDQPQDMTAERDEAVRYWRMAVAELHRLQEGGQTWDEMLSLLRIWLDRWYPVADMERMADEPGPRFTLEVRAALAKLRDG